MKPNPLETRASSDRLLRLAEAGYLNEKALERALSLAGHIPGGAAWKKFLDYVLLILGAGFLISGIFFFFAYNWADMHRFLKFGLIEVGLLITVGLAFYLGLDGLPGKVALTAAALLVGVLLAVFGQAYQTGADAYELFLNWAALIAVWVVISAYAPLWFGLLVLLNITVITYWNQVLGESSPAMFGTLAVLNAVSLFAWEYAHHRGLSWLQSRWFPRLVAPAAFLFLVIPTLEFIFSLGESRDFGPFLILTPFLYLIFTLLVLFFYTKRGQDLFMLTIASLSIIVVATSSVAKLFDFDFDTGVPYLILSLVIIGQAALAVSWLRNIAKAWEAANV